MANIQFSRTRTVYETIVAEVPDEWVDDDDKMESVGCLVDGSSDEVWDCDKNDYEGPHYEGKVNIDRDKHGILDYAASVIELERVENDVDDNE